MTRSRVAKRRRGRSFEAASRDRRKRRQAREQRQREHKARKAEAARVRAELATLELAATPPCVPETLV